MICSRVLLAFWARICDNSKAILKGYTGMEITLQIRARKSSVIQIFQSI